MMRSHTILLALIFLSGRSALSQNAADSIKVLWQDSLEPLTLIQFSVEAKTPDSSVAANTFIRFTDRNGQAILEYPSGKVPDTGYGKSGYYTESPAGTAAVLIGIRKTKGAGAILTRNFSHEDHIGEPKEPEPTMTDEVSYMKPFWKTDTIINETVLLYAENGRPATGKLLFEPSKLLSVKTYDLAKTFSNGKDYSIKGKTLISKPRSSMPFRADTSFNRKANLSWYDCQSQWVVVSYIHKDRWKGKPTLYRGDRLPATIARLNIKKRLNIVAFGMSITRGMNVSGYDRKPPYMRPYVELFANALRRAYGNDSVSLINAALPGSKIDWAAMYADKYVSALHPDLVILDFGMNDFWQYNPQQFGEYTRTIISKIRESNPDVEFLLLSNLKFDPDFVLPSDPNRHFYLSNMTGYREVLDSIAGPGIVNLDMTSFSDELYRLKKAKDFLVNPLHPNDFMARWYAQRMAATLIRNFR